MATPKLSDGFAYPPRLMRADRASAYLSMSESTFLRLVDEGLLPKGKKLNGMTFWDRFALDAFADHIGSDEHAAGNPIENLARRMG